MPVASKILLASGATLITSDPSGVPDRLKLRVYALPFWVMAVGVALASVAVPPLMLKAKSLASRFPVPLAVLYTGSVKTTTIVELSAARLTESTVGDTPSYFHLNC